MWSAMRKQNIKPKRSILLNCCKYINVLVSRVEFESSAFVNLFVIAFYSQIPAKTARLGQLLLTAGRAYLRKIFLYFF